MSGIPQFVSEWLSFLPPWMQAVFYYGVIALVRRSSALQATGEARTGSRGNS